MKRYYKDKLKYMPSKGLGKYNFNVPKKIGNG